MAWVVVAGAAVSVVGGALINKKSSDAASSANNASADAAALQSQIAGEQWDRYKTLYAPLEESLVKDASNYDSPENYAKAAGDAQATVSEQFSKARATLERTPGLDPSSGAYQAGMTNLGLAEAAQGAVQQNAARQKVKDMSYARKTDAIGLGKGLPSSAMNGLSTSANSNLALANANYGQAAGQAGAFGRLTDRVFSSPSVSNWLGNIGKTETPAGAVNAPGGQNFGMDLGFDN